MQPTFYHVADIRRGGLAIMGRPRAGDWASEEFSALAAAGFSVVVSLLEEGEAFELGLAGEARLCADAGMEFWSFPVTDRGVPSDVSVFAAFCRDAYGRCANGQQVVGHCRAGIGRSGLFAASVLLHAGLDADAAFRKIGAARGVSVPDTSEQAVWLRTHSSALRAA